MKCVERILWIVVRCKDGIRRRDGRISIDNNPRSGRPSTVTQDNTNAAILATLLDEDRRITKRKIAARWVPHFLSPEQKDTRKDICRELLSRYENEKETFLDRIIAIDETWIRDFEPELKSQSNIWKGITSPRAKKVRRQQTKVKQMMIFAYDKLGIIVTDRVPIGISVTGDYYKTFLAKKLRPEIRKKRPGMLQNGVSILHGNARPHIGAPVVALLEKYGWERLKHPPYSPDLSTPDFDLFQKLKEPLRRIRFPNLVILNEEVSRRIRELNKDGVLCGIQALPKRWQSCIDKQGDYIEDFWSKEEMANEDLSHPMSIKVKSICTRDKNRYVTDGKHAGQTTLPNDAQPAPLSSVFTIRQNSISS
ncbi:Transposase, type 1 [Cinara cedri]|uniref:Transposase, type 1 n=1 Tax=Cinara cedri TaxID=506608 RepID=A0A5E4MZL1_9HEMI|nr:Transposase, type 1 [Cinara cedri]